MGKHPVRAIRQAYTQRQVGGFSAAGTPLPPAAYRMGGRHFADDESFARSASAEVGRLEAKAGLTSDSRVLDWGCGAGRLAVGLIERLGRVQRYRGVDVQAPLVKWADRHLAREGFEFVHVDLANARYNPKGSGTQQIPGESGAFDVFYAYSVFSHLSSPDVAAYMHELARLLAPGGRAFITAFVESGVDPEAENPQGYGPLHWEGPLHCVRFERGFFESFITDAGLEVELMEHGQETDGQSLYVLRKP